MPDLAITYSELAAYLDCPAAYLLRNGLGFMPPIEGRARLRQRRPPRNASDRRARARPRGSADTAARSTTCLTSDFFLPFANKVGGREMRENARR